MSFDPKFSFKKFILNKESGFAKGSSYKDFITQLFKTKIIGNIIILLRGTFVN